MHLQKNTWQHTEQEISQLLEERILAQVTKPTRYTGGEFNQVRKNWDDVDVTMAFAFPDVYEVGMSHLGLRILYHLVNDQPRMAMERVFAPWTDMEAKMRQAGVPLFALESRKPLKDFDVLGFTLQYEMAYSNILNMLDLAGIPLEAGERDLTMPLVIAGGPCAMNPEPLAPFLDAVILGEGEEVLLEFLQTVADFRREQAEAQHTATGSVQPAGIRNTGTQPASTQPAGTGVYGDRLQAKRELLARLARIPGVYVPSFYEANYDAQGRFRELTPTHPDAPARILKRVVRDFDSAYFPEEPLVPYMQVVHDRIMLEVLRGCTRACRFCQAGSNYRPVRERSTERLLAQAEKLVQATGYDEIALTSLSTADHSCVSPLIRNLIAQNKDKKVGVSLPSLRVDAFSVDLAKEVQKVRKTGLTFAPEAGTQRLRDVINKGVTEEDLMNTVTSAFENGWSTIKLYFMIGLPTETEEDLEGIARLAEAVANRGSAILRQKGIKKGVKITVSTSSFVPKPQTPFQWEPQMARAELEAKQEWLKKRLRDRRIQYSWHDARLSFLEAIFAKGDRRLAAVLKRAWASGCSFDGWSDLFQFEKWQAAFEAEGINPDDYAYRPIAYDEPLPWEHLDIGVQRSYLIGEHEKALTATLTADCRTGSCSGCGVCSTLSVSNDLRGKKG
ncbi:TIGR03960 family B12-binding radical SAM protein [Heliophilum fasciatum]|uniref:Radical SAM family uncharacterized protein n=1 Tax=Heliophilum fasciatum TaxID=35700 RepID=A0A4V2SY09_9FIRM|nr:TIGR03960 family B12-binding radical SAM protein [Heliophilum fasciatum]MCW2277127.1 radical SAM family uncharacterized protein [Heliophilum fasciatum]TCP68236.1 radical SAM family uncharacterized protein [Heliophilum fasciatum]